MPYAESSLPINHIQAPFDPPPLPAFTQATFVGMVDNITRMRNGAAKVMITVEPDYVEGVFKLWQANQIVSVNVAPWEPEFEDWDDGG